MNHPPVDFVPNERVRWWAADPATAVCAPGRSCEGRGRGVVVSWRSFSNGFAANRTRSIDPLVFPSTETKKTDPIKFKLFRDGRSRCLRRSH